MGYLINAMLAIETMVEESQWFRRGHLCNCFLNRHPTVVYAQAIIREEGFLCISTAISC